MYRRQSRTSAGAHLKDLRLGVWVLNGFRALCVAGFGLLILKPCIMKLTVEPPQQKSTSIKPSLEYEGAFGKKVPLQERPPAEAEATNSLYALQEISSAGRYL